MLFVLNRGNESYQLITGQLRATIEVYSTRNKYQPSRATTPDLSTNRLPAAAGRGGVVGIGPTDTHVESALVYPIKERPLATRWPVRIFLDDADFLVCFCEFRISWCAQFACFP